MLAGTIDLEWPAPVAVDRVVLQEAIALGQRVEAWTIGAEVEGQIQTVATGTTIGRKRIVRIESVKTRRIRVAITRALACPTLSTVAVFGR